MWGFYSLPLSLSEHLISNGCMEMDPRVDSGKTATSYGRYPSDMLIR